MTIFRIERKNREEVITEREVLYGYNGASCIKQFYENYEIWFRKRS